MRRSTMILPLLAAACSPSVTAGNQVTTATSTATNTAVAQTPAAASTCASGAALPVTGLCQTEAAALIPTAASAANTAPDGCRWTVNEAATPTGAVLYRAAQCGARPTKLDFTPGTHASTMAYTAIGMLDPSDGPVPRDTVVTLVDTTGADPHARILEEARRAAGSDQAAMAHCRVVSGGTASFPADTLVIDDGAPDTPGEVRSACGPMGLDQDSQTFWRVGQNTAWFFELGQETPGVDPTSFTLIRRDGARWVRR